MHYCHGSKHGDNIVILKLYTRVVPCSWKYKHPSLEQVSLGKSEGGGFPARIASGAAPGHVLRAGHRPGVSRSFHRPLAGGEIYHEEYVELDQRRQYEEHGVHAQAGAAHFSVELKLVGGERDVQQHQGRQ